MSQSSPPSSRRNGIIAIIIAVAVAVIYFSNTSLLGFLMPDLVSAAEQGAPAASAQEDDSLVEPENVADAGMFVQSSGTAAENAGPSPTDKKATRTPRPTPAPTRTRHATVTPGPTTTRQAGGSANMQPTARPTIPARINGLRTIPYSQLPRQARETITLIDEGGPFPYSKDGSVFQNREGLLPGRQSGYYREYTVETPGSDDRGARRIIQGAEGELYYTDDHYDSFKYVVREDQP